MNEISVKLKNINFYLIFLIAHFSFVLFSQWLTKSWLVPAERRHLYYNAIILARQAIENDVTSTLGHGGLGLATGACDNLCTTWQTLNSQLGN